MYAQPAGSGTRIGRKGIAMQRRPTTGVLIASCPMYACARPLVISDSIARDPWRLSWRQCSGSTGSCKGSRRNPNQLEDTSKPSWVSERVEGRKLHHHRSSATAPIRPRRPSSSYAEGAQAGCIPATMLVESTLRFMRGSVEQKSSRVAAVRVDAWRHPSVLTKIALRIKP